MVLLVQTPLSAVKNLPRRRYTPSFYFRSKLISFCIRLLFLTIPQLNFLANNAIATTNADLSSINCPIVRRIFTSIYLIDRSHKSGLSRYKCRLIA